MSSKYKFVDKEGLYFTTSTIVGWTDLFTRDIYRNILLDSIRFCQLNQGLDVHAWVLMTNHLHMICSTKEGKDPGLVLKNLKSFTAVKLIDAIINNAAESSREHSLRLLKAAKKRCLQMSALKYGSSRTFQYFLTAHYFIIKN